MIQSKILIFCLFFSIVFCLPQLRPKHGIRPSFQPSLTTTCPDGSEKSSRESKCFLYVSQPETFAGAQTFCRTQNNGDLVAIRNAFDNILIADRSKEKFGGQMAFIGANVIENDGKTWSWTDHSEIRYENWLNPSAVAIESQINQCSAINPVIRGKWFTVDCFRRLPFICEIPLL